MTARTAKAKEQADVSVILPEGQRIEIGGVQCRVRHIKTREFFTLMGVITRGLGPNIAALNLTGARDPEEMGALMMSALVMSLPQQVEEFIVFVRMVVEPVGGKKHWEQVNQELENPDLDVMLEIVDAIITNERDDMFELLGKARTYLTKWTNMFKSK